MYSSKLIMVVILLCSFFFFISCTDDTPTEVSSEFSGLNEEVQVDENALLMNKLSEEEIDGLYFIREEEKLARDVYIVLGTSFSHRTFENIQQSEQRHTDAVLDLINYYDLDDPAKEEIGEFTNEELQHLYDFLIDLGSQKLDSALVVGAIIEETDIIDIEHLANVTEAENIIQVYTNLINGSENHLRAFVSSLSEIGIEYAPRFLDQQRFDEIINEKD